VRSIDADEAPRRSTSLLEPKLTKHSIWPQVLVAASLFPMLFLCAFILWFHFIFRPSGQEAWGDAAWVFDLGVLTYPVSILCVTIAWLWARKINVSLSRFLWTLSVGALAMPWFLLFAFTHKL
jgi:hypothetical protein